MDHIRKLARSLTTSRQKKRFYEELVDVSVDAVGAERGLLVLREGTRKQVAAARNLDQENLRGREARLSMSIVDHAMETEETVLLADALKEESFAHSDSVHDLAIRSVLCAPIWHNGACVAALYVDSRFIPGAFDGDDARMLETLSDLAGLFFRLQAQADRVAAGEAALLQKDEELTRLREHLQELDALANVQPALGKDEGPNIVGFPGIIGQSSAMQPVFSIMRRVLNNDITILITGESGTGKELVARGIFEHGRRSDKPFVAINCSSIPANLIESELFGHIKGSFTGAIRDKKGLFEVAHTGTLFLDEVGDMPLEMQGKLLRALQYGEIQPVGGVETRQVDVRVLAATNRNLEERIASGAFREDLYYRLNIVTIEVPPLRRRKEDLPALVQHFLDENRRLGLSTVKGISAQGLMSLRKYPWPGNIRELETVLKSACLFAEGDLLGPRDFEALVRPESVLADVNDPSYYEGRTLEEIEKDIILATLERNGGNKKRTAMELGIDRRTLYNKLRRYGR
jgi:transcriptional regulator with GAF, ATPase, and Fis domain